MKNRGLAAIIFLIILLTFFNNYANLLFDDGVPDELRNDISRLYKQKEMQNSFLVEIQNDGSFLIIAENGFIKKLPLGEVTAIDVINLMEEMVEEDFKKKSEMGTTDETVQDLEKVKHSSKKEKPSETKSTYLKGGLKVSENVEFFPWAGKNERFNAELSVSSEENWAGGIGFSAGLAFLRLGLKFRKGSDIVFQKDQKVGWESYGANLMFDLFMVYNFYLSAGFEVALYRAKGKLFEREFFIFKTAYRIEWFEPSVSINVSPSIVELGLFGTKYSMERYHFVVSAGFLF